MFPADLAVIPQPTDFHPADGRFLLTGTTKFFSDFPAKKAEAWLRATLEPTTGFSFPAAAEAREAGVLLSCAEGLPREGYELRVTPERVEIRSGHDTGWFYGVQTLRQLLPPAILGNEPVEAEWGIPCGTVVDLPRFRWRGLMLDTARHFFPVADIRRFLDHMALHKFNVFHWHLVDDQGWRLEIRKCPRLTEIGSRRMESPQVGHRNEGDGVPYGGFYTQDEVRGLVQYAAERHITIVPEIEMPGHVGAMLAAYPELGNTDVPGYAPEVRTRWGVNPNILAPTEEVFAFLEDVLREVMEMFPGEYLHIGGDEAPKEQWEQSARAQKIREAAGVADGDHLQHWFLERIESFLRAHDRRLIGWDEISEGGLSPTAVMMLWRDWKWARRALDAGNSVIMSPASHCYLDYAQGPIETEPEAICGELTLQKTYSFEPVPEGMAADMEARILGIQGNVWTEYIRDRDYLDFMTWPRAAALAEVAWSPRKGRDWNSFARRLEVHAERLRKLGIRHRPLDFATHV